LIDGLLLKPPLAADLRGGHFAALTKLINFLFGDLEVSGDLVNGKPLIGHFEAFQILPDYTKDRAMRGFYFKNVCTC